MNSLVPAVCVVHLDLAAADALQQVCALAGTEPRSRIILGVGRLAPYELEDPRTLHFLLEARRERTLALEVHGSPTIVRAWLHALNDPHPDPPDPGASASTSDRRQLHLASL